MEASEPLLEQAAIIKALHSLSLADACIAAAAQQVGAILLHKDPEFRAIADLPQEWHG
nr:PIN domain-containing protein [Cyanobium sp. WKJ7-Wakatipu]